MGNAMLALLFGVLVFCFNTAIAWSECEPELLVPNGGEVWQTNNAHTVLWSCIEGTVDIWLWNGDASTWLLVEKGVAASSGQYVYVPALTLTGSLFRIKLVFNQGDEITSSTYFAIEKSKQPRSHPADVQSQVYMHPNPATDRCTLRVDHDEIVAYRVYTYDGEKVLSHSFSTSQNECIIFTNELKAGVYIVRVHGLQAEYTSKLVIQR